MRVIDLFAGLGGWSEPFRERGHEVIRVDIEPRFDVEMHADILTATAADFPWRPDIVLASPPCETFSVMTIGRYWGPGRVPKNDRSRLGIELVEATRRLIRAIEPTFFVIENPRGMLRKMPALADLDRRTVTYCQYGHPAQKPTDLWGGFPPSFVARPMCRPYARCHIAAPRGSRVGIQSDSKVRKDPRWAAFARDNHQDATDPALRAIVPYQLALDVCVAAESDLAAARPSDRGTLWGAVA